MIILHDQPSSDLGHIQAIADIREGFALFDYVSINQSESDTWVGQIVQPNQNISTVGGRLDPTILHGLELMQNHTDVQSVKSVQIFDILILGQLQNHQMVTPRLRPLPGSPVIRLSAEQTAEILEFPAMEAGGKNVIGQLLNAEGVALCIDKRKFNYHIMVSGGTGSGKSNVAANLIKQASRYGKCVFVHDAKPDYSIIKNKNTDVRVAPTWVRFSAYGLSPEQPQSVVKLGFYGRCDPDTVDHVVGFRASDFDPDALAALFFPGATESALQYEGFASAAHYLRQQRESDRLKEFSIDQIVAEVERRQQSAAKVSPQDQINDMVVGAIQRKVGQRKRYFPWIDCVGREVGRRQTGRLTSRVLDSADVKRVRPLDVSILAKPGHIVVVDYSGMDEPSYAAILSIFLRSCQQLRRRHRDMPGVVQLVDEAHRVFDNTSRYGDSLASAFERVMREGRSVDHSIILSLQNASQIPGRVMNNLNSKIVMRQNSRNEADAATQTMGKDFAVQSMRLGTGQALVAMHESRAIVLAQMAPSPYELLRTDIEQQRQSEQGTEDDIPF